MDERRPTEPPISSSIKMMKGGEIRYQKWSDLSLWSHSKPLLILIQFESSRLKATLVSLSSALDHAPPLKGGSDWLTD